MEINDSNATQRYRQLAQEAHDDAMMYRSKLEAAESRIAELERDRDNQRAAEEMQIRLREKMEEERDALAVHVKRLRDALSYSSEYLHGSHLNTIGHGSKAHMEMVSALEDTPTTSLARRDAKVAYEAVYTATVILNTAEASEYLVELRQQAEALK